MHPTQKTVFFFSLPIPTLTDENLLLKFQKRILMLFTWKQYSAPTLTAHIYKIPFFVYFSEVTQSINYYHIHTAWVCTIVLETQNKSKLKLTQVLQMQILGL